MSTYNSTHRKQNILEISRNLSFFFLLHAEGLPRVEVVAKVQKREKMLSLQAKEADNFGSKNKERETDSSCFALRIIA